MDKCRAEHHVGCSWVRCRQRQSDRALAQSAAAAWHLLHDTQNLLREMSYTRYAGWPSAGESPGQENRAEERQTQEERDLARHSSHREISVPVAALAGGNPAAFQRALRSVYKRFCGVKGTAGLKHDNCLQRRMAASASRDTRSPYGVIENQPGLAGETAKLTQHQAGVEKLLEQPQEDDKGRAAGTSPAKRSDGIATPWGRQNSPQGGWTLVSHDCPLCSRKRCIGKALSLSGLQPSWAGIYMRPPCPPVQGSGDILSTL